jgi:eukaryotic-like serine/threonine-protein kinase
MAVRIGQLLDGKYRVVRVLGTGGMGAVYEGENTFISRRVAIKVLHSDLMTKPDMVSRFELEAQAAGRIQNDHINEVLDLGTLLDGSRFIVLEFLDGETLKERVKRAGRLTAMQAVDIVRQVLVGLSAAHRAGIIHRDLKPGNVFILWEKLGQRDFVKIIDFGVSKFLLRAESEELDTTHANAVLGTPHYMAPEQLRRSCDVDARADLYSVGVILYKAITGRVPYHAQSIQELIFKLMDSDPAPASRWVPGLDPTFTRILDKAMERDVDKRFQSADEFLAELEQWRMEMSAAELPFFTEDGLISTMHSVSLRRGSSSDVSVPPVHIVNSGSDSQSIEEISEISAVSMPTVDEVGPQVRSGSGAMGSARPQPASGSPTAPPTEPKSAAVEPSPAPTSFRPTGRSKVWGVAAGVVAVCFVGVGIWLLSRTDAAASASPDGVQLASSAVAATSAPSTSGTEESAKKPDPPADKSDEKKGDTPTKDDEVVLSINDLPSAHDDEPVSGNGSSRNTGSGSTGSGKSGSGNTPPEKTTTPHSSPPPKGTSKSPAKTAPTTTRSDWGY